MGDYLRSILAGSQSANQCLYGNDENSQFQTPIISQSRGSQTDSYQALLSGTNIGLNTLEGVGVALDYAEKKIRHQFPPKTPTDYIQNLKRADNIKTISRFLGRGTLGLNIFTGVYDAYSSYKQDIAGKDNLYAETTKSISSTFTSLAMGAATGAIIAGAGVTLAPAIALTLGAGFAGSAIGNEIGNGIVWLRNWADF